MKHIRFILQICCIILLIRSFAFSQGGPNKARYKPSELILKLMEGYSADVINAKYGTTTRSHQMQTDVYLIKANPGQDEETLSIEISGEPGVIYCKPNFYLIAPEGDQSSSPFLDQQAKGDVDSQLAATTLRLPIVHQTVTGENVRIAMIDGGVDFNHPWLLSKPGLLVSRWDYIDNDYLATEESGGSCSGHGTFVAGILRMVAPSSEIYVYRVLDTSGFGDGFSISEAVLKAIEDSCNIINLSLGMVGVHDGLDDALKLAKQLGIMIVASAGNDSTDLNSIFPFPASKEYCIAVAALDSIDRKADFSNYGQKIGLCAPGTWIYAPYPDRMYAWWDGTSFAAPFISASAALIKSKYQDMSMASIDTLLRTTASNIDSLNIVYEGLLGNGLINLTAALDIPYPVMRGDLSGDSIVDITDLSLIISYLIAEGFVLNSYRAGDLDCNNLIDISDLSTLVAFLEGTNPTICKNP